MNISCVARNLLKLYDNNINRILAALSSFILIILQSHILLRKIEVLLLFNVLIISRISVIICVCLKLLKIDATSNDMWVNLLSCRAEYFCSFYVAFFRTSSPPCHVMNHRKAFIISAYSNFQLNRTEVRR